MIFGPQIASIPATMATPFMTPFYQHRVAENSDWLTLTDQVVLSPWLFSPLLW